MKSIILVILVSICCHFDGFSQIEKKVSPTNLLIIDFFDNSCIEIPADLKKGDYFQVRIDNINLNNYYVKINGKELVSTEKLAAPTFPSIDISSLTNFVASYTISAPSRDDITKSQKHLNGVKKGFENDLDITASDTSLVGSGIGANIANYILVAKTKLTQVKLKFKGDVKSLSEILRDVERARLDFFSNNAAANKPDRASIEQSFYSMRENSDPIKDNLQTLKTMIDSYSKLPNVMRYLSKNESKQKSLNEAISSINVLLSKIDEFDKKINDESLYSVIKSIIFLDSSRTYFSFPIEYNGDNKEVTITITPKDPKTGLQTYEVGPIRIPDQRTNTYWSAGGSFFTTGFQQPLYSIETVPPVLPDTATTYQLRDEGTTGEFGIASTLHFGRKLDDLKVFGREIKNCDWFGYHLTLGAGVTVGTSSIRPRILTGGGLSLGKNHNFSIDYGLAIGYNSRYASFAIDSNGVLVDRDDYLSPPIVLIDKLDCSYFVSIGYTFIK